MSKLFEEAIADAKKLKEVAEENAKKAILESVTPQIREFIEEQLLEEKEEKAADKDTDDEDQNETLDALEEEVYLDEGALASLGYAHGDIPNKVQALQEEGMTTDQLLRRVLQSLSKSKV